MRRAILVLAFAVALAAGACGPATGACSPGSATCTRVLFLGNSYTYVNDLPSTFAALARSGDAEVEVAMVAAGGETLSQHAASAGTLDRIASGGWDDVVLQEQSQVPAAADARRRGMSPAAASLATAIRNAGARPLLFVTWAHRNGWPEQGLAGYEAMQAAIDDGYQAVAREIGAPEAPVGQAWQEARRRASGIELWQADGSHPTPAGTYLAACVFYAAVIGRSPEGLGEHGGLSGEDAAALQSIAARVVLVTGGWGTP